MKLVLICERCGDVHSSDSQNETNLIVDFRQKHMSFICQNKKCKHDNIFDFGDFAVQSKKSPLPKMRTL